MEKRTEKGKKYCGRRLGGRGRGCKKLHLPGFKQKGKELIGNEDERRVEG